MAQLVMNDEDNSTSHDDTNSLFEESDDSTDNEEWLFDDEERHSPEHYISTAANLDVDRLRQNGTAQELQHDLTR